MRILLVEDEERLAEVLAEGLKHKGYAVDIINDGVKGYTRISLHRNDYDLVILDLMLPGMSGLDICRQMRAEGITLPILVLTARNEEEQKVNLLLAGADDYLVKPFSFEELAARIQAILRRPTEAVPTVLRALDIELNPAERTVSRDGVPLTLTLKEFGLLEYFLRHPNQVINREDLVAHLWDFNYESFSNVVDVHIKNLRKKLDFGSEPSVIETIRGIGYRLRA
ncbi:TPA: DNA-binding response regulator [Candidatus Kaiserbacteria bacterium]|nr:MAG: Response regulator receiver domain protein (CheY-like) [Parcubacteria group bacterium GW2011_GWA1_56_13]KKW45787.1 MAG: Response regulator receiver domain protein (CheY-like) [Parcubacteria group bacterium GW2011_GWB1_57_6]HCR52151.1 DNA-binding response regulator [Candidatus Kaiserbacteria bacterium]